MSQSQMGELYIVATPIGNLKDISLHALEVLAKVDLIVAEDTRHSKRLLEHFDIKAPMTSLHNFNESTKSEFLIEKIKQGQSLALISDAGTPLISDPGYPLVRDARAVGITIIPIPGSCALITALCASGLATDRFCFEGFLPSKSGTRLNALELLKKETRTIGFYEAPHRIMKSLIDMQQVFGSTRKAVVAKELTKSYERFFAGELQQIIIELEQNPGVIRGEFVILIDGAEDLSVDDQELTNFMQLLNDEKLPTKQAANIAAKWFDCKKKQAYQIALSLN